ncbi:MAG: putative ribosome quality control (RQC) complex YloA/Tae2 family protein [Rhodothermales bacterium]
MLLSYYVIRALSREWGASAGLTGATIVDAYSSSKDELTLSLASASGEDIALRISAKPGMAYCLLQDGLGKPKKNVTPLFRSVYGQRITAVEVADLDRIMDLVTHGGHRIRMLLFGSQPNVVLAGPDGDVKEAFRGKVPPEEMPTGRPAPSPISAQELTERWPKGAQPVAKAISRAVPLFDQWLAAEVEVRANLDVADACLLGPAEMEKVMAGILEVRGELEDPKPVLYRDGRSPVALSLIPLTNEPGEPEVFDTVSAAVSAFVRATLSERGFRSRYDPLLQAIEVAASRAADGLLAMERELSKTSRADRYEHWGHLLMASFAAARAGSESVTAPDLFGDGRAVQIAMDPALTGAENANRYYDRARRSRRAREEAEKRVDSARRLAADTAGLRTQIRLIEDGKTLRTFTKDNEDALASLRGAGAGGGKTNSVPFREYILPSGDVVWVGRNAKQNDQLTFRHAQKHDIWMHARGVAGSHTVLRRPGKTGMPGPDVIEAAASIAAFHSKARGSGLVPVIVTERKYVRKPRKGLVGAVLVEREEVVIVPPGLPSPAE